MSKKEDVKAFLWYVTTNPFRETAREIRDAIRGTSRDITSMKSWAGFCIISFATLFLRSDLLTTISFLIVGVAFYLYYEWRRKWYRHEWKEHRIKQLKQKKDEVE